MESKFLPLWGFIFLQLFIQHSLSHSNEGSLGSIAFQCPTGQYFTGGYCVLPVEVPMTWSMADLTCKRQGQYLTWSQDEDDYKAVDHLAKDTMTHYWIGLNQLTNNETRWSHSDDEVSLGVVDWEDDQPNTQDGKCVFAKKNGYASFGDCRKKYPFICKGDAVLKDYFRCHNGLGINSKLVCDGLNDCGDNSDEINCPSKCAYRIDATYAAGATKPSGTISSSGGNYDNKKTCRWTIFTNVGSTVKVTVTTFNTEKSVDTMTFTTGGIEGSIQLGKISGSVTTRPTFVSADHVMNILLQPDQTILRSSTLQGGFAISWTADVPEVFSNVQMLTATDSIQNLKSPFYDTNYLPHGKTFEWVITAQSKNVITLQFENIDIDNGELYLWEGNDISPSPTLTLNSVPENNIFMSSSKSVRLMLQTGSTNYVLPKGIYIKYWQGCSLDLMASKGAISSPGYTSGKYPDNVDCTWTIRRPTSEARPMSLKFKTFSLQALDYLKVYNNTVDSTSAIHSGDGFSESDTPPQVTSTAGYIKVMFTSNFVLTDTGFFAEFSLDCPHLTVSSETQVAYTDGSVFESIATLKCDTGYSFIQQEFNRLSALLMECEAGGVWNEDRTPNCMITYCSIPPPVSNGFILQSSGLQAGGNVTYQCFDGFSQTGTNIIKCQNDGQWQIGPTCRAEQCPQLTAPANGGLVNDSRDFGSLVTYTCNPGYETMGSITTYCKNGAQWSHPPATCTKIYCPASMIRHGTLNPTTDIRFEMTTTLTCDSGYHINGSASSTTSQSLTCDSDRKFSPVVRCVDIDECVPTSPCPSTENCHNTIGSHVCMCKQGYERLTPNADCTDINECTPNNGKGPCDQNCDNIDGGYTCRCATAGYILYTSDGFNNISLAEGEDGMRDRDVYRIDHTCVRDQCPAPASIANGIVLSQKELFFFEDKLEFRCNLGYELIGVETTTCGSNGAWQNDIPSCNAITCPTSSLSSIPRSTKIYANSPVSYGDMVNIECQYGSVRINLTLYCTYDNGEYRLHGDAPECPEIVCGAPVSVPGSSPAGLVRGSLGDSYEFGCEDGFVLSGMSLHGNTTVTCQENGRWNIGNLTCKGGRCTDPGTPGGAKQVVKSYEVGQLLSFDCDNDGYSPEPSAPLECIVESGIVKWNTTDLPECTDKTPPVFTNCPTSPVYIYRTEEFTYPVPIATDNSGAVKSTTNSEFYWPGLRAITDLTITYVAEDFSGNTANCVIEIKMKEYNQVTLDCSEDGKTVFISEAAGKSVNMSSYVTITNDNMDDTITYTPAETLTFDHSDIGEPRRVDVMATDRWGVAKQCSFLLETKANTCFRELFPSSVSNGGISCTGTSGEITCTVTCNAGYVFNDGNNTKTYNCSNNQWAPLLPPDTCIKYDNPSFIITMEVVYSSTTVASLCLDGHKQQLTNNNATFTQEIFSKCNNDIIGYSGTVEISDMVSTSSSFDFNTIFTVKLLDSTIPQSQKEACRSVLDVQIKTRGDFLDYGTTASCTGETTTVTRKVSSSSNRVLTSGNQCSAGIQKMTVVGEKCVPCPPGQFSSAPDTCTECPDGLFQNYFGQSDCKNCPSDFPVPSTDKTMCVAVCPMGFSSATGLHPCKPCLEDQFWVNKTTCEACPDDGSTLGYNAVTSVTGCKSPCAKGTYSKSGYEPCQDCPVNFYQDQTTQNHCKQCAGNKITQGTKSTAENQCIVLDWTPSNPGSALCCNNCAGVTDPNCCSVNCSQEISSQSCENRCNDAYNSSITCHCDATCVSYDNCCKDYKWKCVDETLTCQTTNCSGHGTCNSYKHNTRFCVCNTGYYGENCEHELDPCDSSPCWNGGTCIKTGHDSYNCSCPVDTECRMVGLGNKRGQDADWTASGVNPFRLSVDDCLQFCLDSASCVAVHYTSNTCFVFNYLGTLEDNADTQFYQKRCSNTPLFGCDRCEDDLVNTCNTTANDCTEYGMCQDLLGNDFNCLCPTTGVFTEPKCEQDEDLCNPDPCKNGGTCVSYGSVRYQCICKDGFTEKNCETNIDECSLNPNGCLFNGTCDDGIDKYTCTCVSGFTGDRCKDAADFCERQKPCPDGICYNNYDTLNPVCVCEDPYRNDGTSSCERIPNCETDHCINGTCNTGTGKCVCTAGFEGSLCQHNIDDCSSNPCKNNATCMDKLGDYECQCPVGYDKKNCDNNIDDCVGMCTDSNAVQCDDLLNDYMCQCKPGFMGKNCTEEIDECLSYPCQHSGTCMDLVNDFKCNCTDGWEGKNCSQPKQFCTPSTCLNDGECYNMINGTFCKCKDGTTGTSCGTSPEVCAVINPCINGGTCKKIGGTAECDCPQNYDGSSCHLIDNVCGMSPPKCQNEGTCQTKNLGYQCTCKDSYSGTDCQIYTDPCSPGRCHSTAKCLSDKDKYMCYCDQGRPLTDGGCKNDDENFDIFFDNTLSNGQPAMLNEPFVLPRNSSLTIMFWARVVRTKDIPVSFVQLKKVDIGTNQFEGDGDIIINDYGYSLFNENVTYGILDNGRWHFVVLSINSPNDVVKYFIDAVKIHEKNIVLRDEDTVSVWQLMLGKNAHGRISQLRIYKSYLSDEDIYRSRESYSHLPAADLVQGWTNIALSQTVTRIFPSSYKTEDICDTGISNGCPEQDRKKPTVVCPENQSKHGTSRFTLFDGLKTAGNYSDDVTSKNYSVNEDNVYTFGSSNEVLLGFDMAENYGICHFKVYVRYNDVCTNPVTDATITQCDDEDNDDICKLECTGSRSLSKKHRFRYNCGKLGVFNHVNPYKPLVLPTCGATSTQTLALTVRMTYELVINCFESAASKIEEEIAMKIKGNVQTQWPGMCSSCIPSVIAECQANSKLVNAEFTIQGLQTTITKDSKTYKIRDAILIIILQEKMFEFSNVASSKLQEDSVTVTESPSCTSGYVVVGDDCVECGKGSYRNDTTMTCEFCPIGSYQESSGQTSCISCGSDKTTTTYGSDSNTDCKDFCPPGKYYDSNSCKECERHYYQDQSGQDYCLPCPLGTKTSNTGSNSSSNCYQDCETGTEIQTDGTCKVCERGYYRSSELDNCQSCDATMTTPGSKSSAASDCRIRICLAGNFRNATRNVCEPCPVGEYQSEDLQDFCNKCPTDYTTDGEGKTHQNNCTYYCPEGQEIVPGKVETCQPCPRGSYRSTNEDEILLPCQNCTGGNTTETTGSTKADQCSIRKCEAGQRLDSMGECEDCLEDFYQPNELPDSNTVCTPCSPGKGTKSPKATSADQCFLTCLAGEQSNGASCEPCRQGTWSNGNMTMRFEQCYDCPDNYTTVGIGATHPDNCTLRDCPPGTYISGSDCVKCDFGQYQPMRHQDMCMNCSAKQNTSSMGSVSQSACQIYCPKGEEGNVTCSKCKEDHYKPDEGIAPCTQCEGNYTSDINRDTCSVLYCDYGLYNDNGDCTPCPIGQYKDVRGSASSCKSCDPGLTTVTVGSKNCSVLFCVPGRFENTTTNKCEPCPKKTYKATSGIEACTDCPANKTTAGDGATSVQQCSVEYCDPGEKRTSSNTCMKCPVGSYQSMYGQDDCVSCGPGYTTEGTGKTSHTECFEICKVGFQFDAVDTKTCKGCELGYYKNVVGNDKSCDKCPVNKTTANVNSTSINDCNIDDCLAGYKREAGGCVPCEKGSYQSQTSQTSCITCSDGYTTESAGSYTSAQCIRNCDPGKQYNYNSSDCEDCAQGYITDRTKTAKCFKCPAGKTTLYGGSNTCIKNTVTTPATPTLRTLKIKLKFRVRLDCAQENSVEIIKNLVNDTLISRLKVVASRYKGLCFDASCTNINTLIIRFGTCIRYFAGRRKRAVEENEVTFDIEIPDVPTGVENIDSGLIVPTETVVQEDLTVNPAEYSPNSLITAIGGQVSTVVQCTTGSIGNNAGTDCVPCPAGTKYVSTGTPPCQDCPLNTYQSSTGQTTCIQCPGTVKIYTLTTKSNSSSQCISECDKTPSYCNSGTCIADSISVYCTCTEEYEGNRCQTKKEKTSSTPAIIGGAIGGGVGLLIIVLIIILICMKMRPKRGSSEGSERMKFKQVNDADSDAPFRNPIYDNRAYRGPFPVAYTQDWHNGYPQVDPYEVYMPRQGYPYLVESDEDYHVRGTPRGNVHQFYAA